MAHADRTKWDDRYGRRDTRLPLDEPAEFLVSLADQLPTTGRALDVAGGTGRNAIWLAQRGLGVTLADISPVGLQLASEYAEAAGVVIERVEVDFDVDAFPAGPWDVIVEMNYLPRSSFGSLAEFLAPGGAFIFSQPTLTNLERNDRPPRDFLLAPGELPDMFDGLTIEFHEECWWPSGVHEARLVARRS
ncbi:MAG: class I SAM-dependent methyltransferase [Pirellulales bacterium]|nr:class I SAM-dependent methyltransferase [Pirellulales bacterium]